MAQSPGRNRSRSASTPPPDSRQCAFEPEHGRTRRISSRPRWRFEERRTGTAEASRHGASTAAASCSGYLRSTELSLPRRTREQYDEGRNRSDEVQAGGSGVLRDGEPRPSHVGIALGGGEFVHAPSSRGVVRVESYTSGYWVGEMGGCAPHREVQLKHNAGSTSPAEAGHDCRAYAARNLPLRPTARRISPESPRHQIVLGRSASRPAAARAAPRDSHSSVHRVAAARTSM